MRQDLPGINAINYISITTDEHLKSQNNSINAAIIYLVREYSFQSKNFNTNLIRFISSCEFVEKYPIYFLSEYANKPEIQLKFEKIKKIVNHTNIELIDISPHWNWSNHSTDSYKKMCQFYTSYIFKIEQISVLDYFMRLDCDSFIECIDNDNNNNNNNNDKIKIDPFEVMKSRQSMYGYYSFQYDNIKVSINNRKFIKQFIEDYEVNIDGMIAKDFIFEDKENAPTFYNNLEIVYVPYFNRINQINIDNLNKEIDKSNGIYLYRWGDAIHRFWQISLFLNYSDIMCLTENNTFLFYQHNYVYNNGHGCLKQHKKWIADIENNKLRYKNGRAPDKRYYAQIKVP